MKVCFLVGEIFEWGKYGGFGFLTRKIGSELALRGIEVSIIVPLGVGQNRIENLDGMTVFGYEGGEWGQLKEILKNIDVDVFHSQEPNLATYIAKKIRPEKKHVTTFQDPRGLWDWWNEFQYSNLSKKRAFPGMIRFEFAYNPCIRLGVLMQDGLFCQAKYIREVSQRIYGLNKKPLFLPNPIDVPDLIIEKADRPTVCFLARWDRRKRPWIFIELARKFPEIDFLMGGRPDENILKKHPIPKNLKLLGLIQGKEKEFILSRSWAMINTSTRECLPVSFLEASAYKCAIISSVDPDKFATDFGFLVENDDYDSALKKMIEGDWKIKGEAGHSYVKKIHETKKVIDQHLDVYKGLLV